MAVYFKYKSAKDYDSIPIVDQFISVGNLKLKIFESKRYGKGKDFDLLIANSQSNEYYVDQATLIPKNTSVLISRVPGLPRLPIVIPSLTGPKQVCEEEEEEEEAAAAHSVKTDSLDFDCSDFGDDVYAIPKILPIQSGNPVPTAPTSRVNDEYTKIKNLIHTPDVGQSSNGYGFGRVGMEWKRPPSGYVCHRCNGPGHFIQHCPTNGDPNYDIRRVKPPTKSMSMASPSGSVGVLRHNEAVFSKEVAGLASSSSSSSNRSFRDIPPELYCPLCKGLMKDAVIASKCCFSSFCDKCIRDHIISNSVCVCGARNILVDALLPNITLRVTVNRIMESGNSSSEHGVSAPRVQDMVSAHNTPRKISFPSESVDELQQKPTAGEAVKMKKRKKPSDVDVVNMQGEIAQDHVVAESSMLTMNPTAYHPYCTGKQYNMNYGYHVLPEESLSRGQYVETRSAGLKRKREMSIEIPSVITC
ncbi:E3 ubiquitin-protein ligase rbbp6 [Datura stramonium]|uniref:E3 ubiquitin-protein ligase rbbp6 n=1 Tax=Datura stramonium TaxID=4076 RepID=A0ABS8V8T8_DATST|nr:E3 ubiquitin-protein ligase rbbp6 [Datura stramonium]